MRKIIIQSLMFAGLAFASQAQAQDRVQPRFWFGLSGAANLNFYDGTTQTINATTKAPTALHKGMGISPYASVFMEYRSHKTLGFMLNVAYDDRSSSFNKEIAPCNCPEKLTTKLTYLVIEPSLRLAPFHNNFYMFVGAVLSSNMSKSFTYTQDKQPDKSGDMSDVKPMLVSGQVGMGYEIPLSRAAARTQFNLSPFVSYHPYFGREPRSIESWSIQTLRFGMALKFGVGPKAALPVVVEKEKPKKEEEVVVVPVIEPVVVDKGIQFVVKTPLTVPSIVELKETFPLRNSIFFDEGSSDIPNRYVKLSKSQASTFNEDQFIDPKPKDMAGRSQRQLSAYYNILNIIAARMKANPSSTINLSGSSAGKGAAVGKAEADAVKNYLVDIHGISASRITTEGRNMPAAPSAKAGHTTDLAELNDEDRRVDISSNPSSLVAPLQIAEIQSDPATGMINFNTAPGIKDVIKNWKLEITDSKGNVQYYGPYTSASENIAANTILGENKSGDYKVVMIAETKEGKEMRKDASFHLERGEAVVQQSQRYSVLFDFDAATTNASYVKFLNEVVAPQISSNSKVSIHGHADAIGESDHNLKLSRDRAEAAKNILAAALARAGKTGVQFEVYGAGEDPNQAPFKDKLPEEHFYNRTVIIDIAK